MPSGVPVCVCLSESSLPGEIVAVAAPLVHDRCVPVIEQLTAVSAPSSLMMNVKTAAPGSGVIQQPMLWLTADHRRADTCVMPIGWEALAVLVLFSPPTLILGAGLQWLLRRFALLNYLAS